PVVLDDLASPRFPPAIDDLRAAMAEMAPSCPLEASALVDEARRQTGLHHVGDGAFLARLEVLCAALRTEADLSPAGVVSWYSQLLGLMKNRLLIEDLLRRHPEIHDIEIVRPIIIAGLPRTGTTHLHNLMGADPTLRSLPYWESLEPVLADAERPVPGQPDPRVARTAFALDILNQALPYFKRMHEITVDHVHEEIQLLAIDVSTMLFETPSLIPSWRDAYRATDQTPSYAYLRTVLKVLQWARGGTRWVLKSPQHLEQFGPLRATFPDATFVVTHRDPVAVTVSMAAMVAYTARMHAARVDPSAIGSYWTDRVESLFRACARDRALLPADQSIDVGFAEFMADDMAMVGRIYDLAGQPFTGTSRRAMTGFIESHRRGRHGTVVYEPEILGIDTDAVRRSLAFYSQRFGVEPEG
ncbi:MAG: sulfotransferase family protein, partial [Acidimicrobiales bacterium]